MAPTTEEASKAVETVQDPQSNETAEKAMVEQSLKAGVPAFQFDPDASPKEKAEAVKSVGHDPCARISREISLRQFLTSPSHP